MIHMLVGAGGTGGFIAPALSRLVRNPQDLVIIDRDRVERKNLLRQVFTMADIGRNKASILAERNGCGHLDAWFDTSTHVAPKSVIWCAADNNQCRMDILSACDRFDCVGILGGNEQYSSEALIYFPAWQGTRYDFRVIYPSATTDQSGRPMNPCASDITVQEKPQTVCSNFTSSCFMLRLFFAWLDDNGRLVPRHAKDKPVHLRAERTILFEALGMPGKKVREKSKCHSK